MLAELAAQRNRQPLPALKVRHGLRLPPEEDCLLGAAYQLRRGDPAGPAAQPMDVDGSRCVTLQHLAATAWLRSCCADI